MKYVLSVLSILLLLLNGCTPHEQAMVNWGLGAVLIFFLSRPLVLWYLKLFTFEKQLAQIIAELKKFTADKGDH